MNGLTERLSDFKEIPLFIEKSLPLLILMQTSDFMKNVFAEEGPAINKRIIDHEKKIVGDINEYNATCIRGHDIKLKKLNKRL